MGISVGGVRRLKYVSLLRKRGEVDKFKYHLEVESMRNRGKQTPYFLVCGSRVSRLFTVQRVISFLRK